MADLEFFLAQRNLNGCDASPPALSFECNTPQGKTMKNVLPLFALIAFSLPDAHAATVTVTATADSGAGSLRAAIAAAAGGDTIQFAAALNGQTITLTSAQLVIDKDLTIDGPGPNQLTVKRSTAGGTPGFRIFQIAPVHTVTIEGITISNGLAQGNFPGSAGAGIYNDGSVLTIANCIINGNSAAYGGGGIFNDATNSGSAELMVRNSILSGNAAAFGGAAIYNYGYGDLIPFSVFASVEMSDSTISDNSAVFGAGVYSDGSFEGNAFLTITNCTISGNTASDSGGGIYNNGEAKSGNAYVSVSNSTISGNSAGLGGAIVSDGTQGGGAIVGITTCTISDNSAGVGGGIYNQTTTTRSGLGIGNTILRAGPSGGNIHNESGPVFSYGYNLSSDDGGGFLIAAGDQINTNPMLGPLQDNGGPTLTHALLPGSAAINGGNPSFTPPPEYDQRGLGFPRAFNGRIDIGSFELQAVAPTPAPATLVNISTRLRVLTADNALIGGFIVTGNTPKRVIVRAIGPSLASFGIPGVLADPVLELHGPGAFATITNDNWRDTQASEIEATGIAPSNDLESAIVATLSPGAYTAVVRGNNGGTGVGLVETYDLELAADAQLANISTRGFVDLGDNVMIGGLILGNGNMNARVLIRAIGPSLSAFGVPDALADPVLELRDNNGALIGADDDWRDTQQAEIEATGIPPGNDRESAIVQTLAPGTYTAIVRGKNDTTGVALVEAYRLGSAAAPIPSPTPTATATPTSTPTATATATPTSTPVATPTPTATVPPMPTATPTPSPTPGVGPAKFGVLSSSAMVGTGDAIVLNAFIITGPDPTQVLVRGLGPSLGVSMVLADPALDLRTSAGALVATNDNWRSDQEAEIIGTGIPPTNDFEAAIVATLSPGSYTVVLRGINNTTGRGTSDLHDLSPAASSSLTAIGTRSNVLTADDVLVSEIVLEQGGGDLLLRVLGPSLGAAGIANILADPALELRDGNGALLIANDNWRDAQEAAIQATGLAPSNDLESAMVASLAPGSYTTVVRGKNNTTGIGYIQFYSLPHSGPVLKLTP
jgi:hypothetical protein